jgi:hypothetical protein
VNDSEGCSGGEFGPVGGLGEPIEVEAEEVIHSGSSVHDGVGKNGGGVIDGEAGINALLEIFLKKSIQFQLAFRERLGNFRVRKRGIKP